VYDLSRDLTKCGIGSMRALLQKRSTALYVGNGTGGGGGGGGRWGGGGVGSVLPRKKKNIKRKTINKRLNEAQK